MSKSSEATRFTIPKNISITSYHQEMLNELKKAHNISNESELFRHLIEWEWEFIHVWDLPEERKYNGK